MRVMAILLSSATLAFEELRVSRLLCPPRKKTLAVALSIHYTSLFLRNFLFLSPLPNRRAGPLFSEGTPEISRARGGSGSGRIRETASVPSEAGEQSELRLGRGKGPPIEIGLCTAAAARRAKRKTSHFRDAKRAGPSLARSRGSSLSRRHAFGIQEVHH